MRFGVLSMRLRGPFWAYSGGSEAHFGRFRVVGGPFWAYPGGLGAHPGGSEVHYGSIQGVRGPFWAYPGFRGLSRGLGGPIFVYPDGSGPIQAGWKPILHLERVFRVLSNGCQAHFGPIQEVKARFGPTKGIRGLCR